MAVSVPAGPNKAVIPAGHPVDDPTAGVQEDAVLESCEEPVPIAEPAGAPPADVPRSKSPCAIPIPPEEDSSEDSSYTPRPPDDIGSALPDHIDLAPPQQPHPQVTPP